MVFSSITAGGAVTFDGDGGAEARATNWVSTAGVAGAAFGCGGNELPEGAVFSVLTCPVLTGTVLAGLAVVDGVFVDLVLVDPAFVELPFVGTLTMTFAGGARESREMV
jgi:hypothetical protein